MKHESTVSHIASTLLSSLPCSALLSSNLYRHSMAAGGSVVHPAVPCILVTPICPHVLSFRSMIFPDHVVLRCYVPDDARSEASVAFDGKHRQELRRGDSVQIQMSPYPVPTINRMNHSADWLGSLKRNFNFNTRPRQKPLQ
jgi:NAD+ kinase